MINKSPKPYLVEAWGRSFVAQLRPEEYEEIVAVVPRAQLVETDPLTVAATIAGEVKAGRCVAVSPLIGRDEVLNLLYELASQEPV